MAKLRPCSLALGRVVGLRSGRPADVFSFFSFGLISLVLLYMLQIHFVSLVCFGFPFTLPFSRFLHDHRLLFAATAWALAVGCLCRPFTLGCDSRFCALVLSLVSPSGPRRDYSCAPSRLLRSPSRLGCVLGVRSYLALFPFALCTYEYWLP